jgi:hypothetical protein
MRNELSPIGGAFRAQGISNEVRPLASQDLKSCTTLQVFYLGGDMRSFHSCLMRFGHNLVTNFPLPCVKVLSCTLQSWRKSSRQSSNYGRKPNLTPAQITSQCGVQCGLAVVARRDHVGGAFHRQNHLQWSPTAYFPIFETSHHHAEILLWIWHIWCANSGTAQLANFNCHMYRLKEELKGTERLWEDCKTWHQLKSHHNVQSNVGL